MKKIIASILAAAFIALGASADEQLRISVKGGTVIENTADGVTTIQLVGNGMQVNVVREQLSATEPEPDPEPNPDPTVPTAPAVEWVDLGLPSGNLWASANIGAATPEEFGWYFHWSETTPYIPATADSYPELPTLSNADLDARVNSNLCLLDEYDAAKVFIGGEGVSMPYKDDVEELIKTDDYTTKEEATINGVKGLKIISKANGNYIFIPSAGRYETSGQAKSIRCLWSGSKYNANSQNGGSLDVNGTNRRFWRDTYTYRYPIRAIKKTK